METHIEFTERAIEIPPPGPSLRETGAAVEFHGIVRGLENGQPIPALRYEAHVPMARHQLALIIDELQQSHPCQVVWFMHRLGAVPVGEASLYVRVHSMHRQAAFQFAMALIDRMKADVPIWKSAARAF